MPGRAVDELEDEMKTGRPKVSFERSSIVACADMVKDQLLFDGFFVDSPDNSLSDMLEHVKVSFALMA